MDSGDSRRITASALARRERSMPRVRCPSRLVPLKNGTSEPMEGELGKSDGLSAVRGCSQQHAVCSLPTRQVGVAAASISHPARPFKPGQVGAVQVRDALKATWAAERAMEGWRETESTRRSCSFLRDIANRRRMTAEQVETGLGRETASKCRSCSYHPGTLSRTRTGAAAANSFRSDSFLPDIPRSHCRHPLEQPRHAPARSH